MCDKTLAQHRLDVINLKNEAYNKTTDGYSSAELVGLVLGSIALFIVMVYFAYHINRIYKIKSITKHKYQYPEINKF